MGRKSKVTGPGRTRTTLLRTFQIGQLDQTAERLGCEFSDVVRATLDMLIPADPEETRFRTLAALERNLRELRQYDSNIAQVLIDGWCEQEMMLPIEIARRPTAARLVEETAKMLRHLDPTASSGRRPDDLPKSVFGDVERDLLIVLSSPAVRILDYTGGEHRKPSVFLASGPICPPISSGRKDRRQEPGGVSEAQYQEPRNAMVELMRNGRIRDESARYVGNLGSVLRCFAFQINWKHGRKDVG